MDKDQINACQNNSSVLCALSIAKSYTTAALLSYLIVEMKTVEETRWEKLQCLVQEAGSIANLNRAAKRNERDATVSQILNRWSGKSGKPKQLGSDMARELESAMGKPRGWMDNDLEQASMSWPFQSVTHEQIASLEEGQLRELEAAMRAELRHILAANGSAKSRSAA